MKTRQGVTLEILGKGRHQRGSGTGRGRPRGAATAGRPGRRPAPGQLDVALRRRLSGRHPRGAAGRFAYLVPHGALRTFVMGSEARPPKPDELDRMVHELDAALTEGAIGLSTGLIYPPCCYAEREELVALAQVAGRHKGPVVVHLRSESDYILEAVDEMVDVCRRGGCALHISHWEIAGRENFGRAQAMIDRVEEAQRSGLTVTCDNIPDAAGSTMLGAILPPWVHDGGPESAVARLSQHLRPSQDARGDVLAAASSTGTTSGGGRDRRASSSATSPAVAARTWSARASRTPRGPPTPSTWPWTSSRRGAGVESAPPIPSPSRWWSG